jgi:hypothetical protein
LENGEDWSQGLVTGNMLKHGKPNHKEGRKSSDTVRGSLNAVCKIMSPISWRNSKPTNLKIKIGLLLFLEFCYRKAVRFAECLQTWAIAWK